MQGRKDSDSQVFSKTVRYLSRDKECYTSFDTQFMASSIDQVH